MSSADEPIYHEVLHDLGMPLGYHDDTDDAGATDDDE
jgi:hypothetical protein